MLQFELNKISKSHAHNKNETTLRPTDSLLLTRAHGRLVSVAYVFVYELRCNAFHAWIFFYSSLILGWSNVADPNTI